MAQGDDLRVRHLDGEVDPGEEDPQHHKDGAADQAQENGVAGGAVGDGKVLLPQVPGQQGVDAHAGAGGHGDHQVLDRVSKGHGSQSRLADVGDEHAVHHVVQGLDEHRDHHRPGHGKEQAVDGHDAHLVLLSRLR